MKSSRGTAEARARTKRRTATVLDPGAEGLQLAGNRSRQGECSSGPAPANVFCSMEEEWIISPSCSSTFFTRVCGCSA